MNRHRVLLLFSLAALFSAPTHGDEPREAASLATMQALVKRTHVLLIQGEEEIEAELQRQPVFRYSDQIRGIRDAGLWVWMHAGRPVAFQKVEDSKLPDSGELVWTYCFTTLADQPVHAKWSDTREYKSKQVARRFQSLSDEPMPGKTIRIRAAQMRSIARQFSATIINDPQTNNKEEMRLLPRPILEYEVPEQGVLAGSVFGFAFGTNPDLLLAIELRRREGNSAEWHFAVARMTTAGIRLRWQDREVWSDDWVHPTPKPFEAWTFFFVPREDE